MFERYLTDALTTHFGHVVENVDADKVRLSAWNGEVVLQDLKLKSNALDSFVPDCPVELAYGRVGNLEVRYPWTLFRSQLRWRKGNEHPRLLKTTCSVVLTDVNILITPRRKQSTMQEEAPAEPEDTVDEGRKEKERQVQSIMDANLLRRVTESSVSSSRWNWVQDWLSSLLATLSVTVQNIHVRYEDPGNCMGFAWTISGDSSDLKHYRPSFSVGVMLRELSVDTAAAGGRVASDEEGDTKPESIKPKSYETRSKIGEAQDLAVYWDSGCKLISNHPGHEHTETFESTQDRILQALTTSQALRHKHSYLLEPISPSVVLTLVSERRTFPSTDGLESVQSYDSDGSSHDSLDAAPNEELTPPSSVRINLPPCKVMLARSTLEDIAYIRKSLSVWKHSNRGILSEKSLRRLAKLRPARPPGQEPRKWWFYAFEATLVLSRVNREGVDLQHVNFYRKRRRGWIGLIEALRRRRAYMQKYRALMMDSTDADARLRAHNELLEIEDELFPQEIAAFRLAVYEAMEVVPSDKSANAHESGWRSWVTSSGEADESLTNVLSVAHRSRMISEMIEALDRERQNVRKSFREGNRRSSILESPLADLSEENMNAITWQTSLQCKEVSIQINDKPSNDRGRRDHGQSRELRVTPVIRVSSALMQRWSWYQDGSWDIDCSLGGLLVKDLLMQTSKETHTHFSNLLSRKQSSYSRDADYLTIDGDRYHKCLSLAIHRKIHWMTPEDDDLDMERGSETRTEMRILPLEIIYSTLPVEALTRVLMSVKTPELVDDYQRMAAAAHGWRERQKKKFLEALAHKHKKIIIDIDVGAPEVLIPENINRPESPMLAIDLGRLRIFNDSSSKETSVFDDGWGVNLSNVQVKSATVASRLVSDPSQGDPLRANSPPPARQIVEPFSVDFSICTKIASADSEDQTRVQVSATLPRLAFNLTSSSIRLVVRLQRQWDMRRREMQAREEYFLALSRQGSFPFSASSPRSAAVEESDTVEIPVGSATRKGNASRRLLELQFSAPLVSLRLDNDVEVGQGRTFELAESISGKNLSQVPLVDLAFLGIRGSLRQKVESSGEITTTFGARLHSLGVIDLYQTAGKEFAMLMSSAPPDVLKGLHFDGHGYSWQWVPTTGFDPSEVFTGPDLVTIEFISTRHAPDDVNSNPPDKISVWFHELYVQWNPETLASIQKAVRVPPGVEEGDDVLHQGRDAADSVSDDEFFDAVEEEEFFDSISDNDSAVLVSEISSSFEVADDDHRMSPALFGTNAIGLGSTGFRLGFQGGTSDAPNAGLRGNGRIYSSVGPFSTGRPSYHVEASSPAPDNSGKDRTPKVKQREVVFSLSKLRVCFNKETRHRKVFIAQMDGTSVSYSTREAGGSRTLMSIGNLVFYDPSSSSSATLYGQILGLKTRTFDKAGGQPSSLLEMEVLTNPRTRSFSAVPVSDDSDNSRRDTVTIDRQRGVVSGCNNFVKARLSPMRFVFLEQLWFEILDYFFEGIIGAAVWGTKVPAPSTLEDVSLDRGSHFLPGSDAKGFNFTLFEITLVSPELLLPVTYKSPHFLRLELQEIHVKNMYNSSRMPNISSEATEGERIQWFNNCRVSLKGLQLFSWNGKELGKKPLVATVSLRWPSGPTAYLVIPKWRVKCDFDSLDVTLGRADYALVQHIISCNIGEPSRHLDEWYALLNLTSEELVNFRENLLVHFGYDKKDVTPTTYSLTVKIPSVAVTFVDVDRNSEPLAVARCLDLVWTLNKASSLVVKQRATCDIDLVAPAAGGGPKKLLSSSKYDKEVFGEEAGSAPVDSRVPELTYSSTTLPSGDNTKALEIVDACIYSVIPAWRRFVSFFSSLPEPFCFDECDISSLVQAGDRWYKISDDQSSPRHVEQATEKATRFDWIKSYSPSATLHEGGQEPRSSVVKICPTFQLLVSLTAPRIVFEADPVDEIVSRLVLRMSHLEYLHVNSGVECSITRSFFLDEVEVYALSGTSSKRRRREGENSLIHPWSVAGLLEKCNGKSVGSCDLHSVRISADVLEARAAYSDMTIAVEVCQNIFQSAKEQPTPLKKTLSQRSSDEGESHRENLPAPPSDALSEGNGMDEPTLPVVDDDFCVSPIRSVLHIECEGFELLVADDSGRHFAGSQDLLILSLGKLLVSTEESLGRPSSAKLRLHSLDLYDCLQKQGSPFRNAASSRWGAMGLEGVPTSLGSPPNEACPTPNQRNEARMAWGEFKVENLGKHKYGVAPALRERVLSASWEAPRYNNADTDQSSPELIEISRLSTGVSQVYSVKLRSLAVQWNPSTIIAVQRFLGRLRKESRPRVVESFQQEIDDLIASQSMESDDGVTTVPEVLPPSPAQTVRAEVILDSFTLCLNKEHLHRRLLEVTFTSCQVEVNSSEDGLSLDGRLGDLKAWDSDKYSFDVTDGQNIIPRNRILLEVTVPPNGSSSLNEERPFLDVRYRTFRNALSTPAEAAIPAWVHDHASQGGGIDDFLSMRVASAKFTYLKSRTEELVDYLSNGLPGKGMGMTSRAAKGFISKRILTRSFLEFHNESPQIFIPQHESVSDGITLKLGDANVRSYFEPTNSSILPSDHAQEWCRMLSLELTGFRIGVARNQGSFSELTNSVDLTIELRKPTSKGGEVSVHGQLSFVELMLKYSDYVLLRSTARDNLTRNIDTDKWDNVEKAYWLEESGGDHGAAVSGQPGSALKTDTRVTYATNARFVRYGKAGRRMQKIERNDTLGGPSGTLSASASKESSSKSLDLRFELDGLSVKLTRDDIVLGADTDDIATALSYDMLLLRVQVVELSVTGNESGDISFHLSLFRIGLFDLGDNGRLMRERYYAAIENEGPGTGKGKRKGLRQPCPFQVLVEGYTRADEEKDTAPFEEDPQVLVTVDRYSSYMAGGDAAADYSLPPESKMTSAKVVVNCLSVNALIRPFKELLSFLGSEWPSHGHQPLSRASKHNGSHETGPTENDTSKPGGNITNQALQLKLVAHYPQVFFLADESDPRSRALVLRGLAVVNLSKVTVVNGVDIQKTTSLDAQLHSMESYINPDVDEALRFKQRHAEMVGRSHVHLFPQLQGDHSEDSDTGHVLGVALIQPVTTGIEFCEVERVLFATKRSLFVNMEPVSITLSFEDLSLIEAVLARWSSARSRNDQLELDANNVGPSETSYGISSSGVEYEVSFETQRLGLGLKTEAGRTVVSSIQNNHLASEIRTGDSLVAVDKVACDHDSLDRVVKLLSVLKRPIVIKFRRSSPPIVEEDVDEVALRVVQVQDDPVPETSDECHKADYFVSSYTVLFKKGVPSGLQLRKSTGSRFAVVSKVLTGFEYATATSAIDASNSEQIEATFQRSEVRTPRPGAIVVAIDGVSTEEMDQKKTWDLLKSFSSEVTTSSDDSKYQTIYSISFKELDSSLWGIVETIDVCSSGIALSFIDDLHGRDMPLFRGNLGAVQIHADRGLEVETRIIEVTMASLLALGPPSDMSPTNEITLSEAEIKDLRSEVVTTFGGISMCSVDYFHPRIAQWEPLVEPSQIFVSFERQAGSTATGRPGQIAMETSDRLLPDYKFKGGTVPNNVASRKVVALNVTDASAEVLVKAITQWKLWRQEAAETAVQEDMELDAVLLGSTSGPTDPNIGTSTSLSDTFESNPGNKLVVPAPSGAPVPMALEAKRLAAQKAVQAALVYAQKRGAGKDRPGDAAKPFVFRNRTGVSVAFVQQSMPTTASRHSKRIVRHLSVVGEYAGLAQYDSSMVQELADQEDAKFSMEAQSDPSEATDAANLSSRSVPMSNKVRTYDGRFPPLTVAIQAVAGVLVEPLVDLQVYKVGSSIHHLLVRRDSDEGVPENPEKAQYSIPVVWKVEIEDNRRILTLSTAVRVMTTAYNSPLEVGVAKVPGSISDGVGVGNVESVSPVGVARPESPLYLPLWLALKLEPVNVHIRPFSEGQPGYEWGASSVLRFSPVSGIMEDEGDPRAQSEPATYTWKETFDRLRYVHCKATETSSNPVWLVVFGMSPSTPVTNEPKGRQYDKVKLASPTLDYEEEHHEVISVTVDSSLTLRNMLPLSLDWELAHSSEGSAPVVVDGASRSSKNVGVGASSSSGGRWALNSGECHEVFSCDFQAKRIQARFRDPTGRFWSTWAPLSLEDDGDLGESEFGDQDYELQAVTSTSQQINVQVVDDNFGVPLTFGVRVVPKSTLPVLEEPMRGQVYGLEVIVYAELWIRNITTLPLNFGCPSHQLHGQTAKTGGGDFDDLANRFNAESALMEIASLLEVGDKGTSLSKKAAREVAQTGGIESLPHQECDELSEEVFEYLEIEYSTVKRRWWASESYDSYRKNITQEPENESWAWINDKWNIDCSGEVKASLGGWESCRNLLAGAGSFNSNRSFDPSHSIRRRRYFRARSGRHISESPWKTQASPKSSEAEIFAAGLQGGLQAFHQPIKDSFTREQRKLRRKRKRKGQSRDSADEKLLEEEGKDAPLSISLKCGDGKWSLPTTIPDTGTANGVIRVLASRWPGLTRSHQVRNERKLKKEREEVDASNDLASSFQYRSAHLGPELYELCYTVSDVEGEWGEFSRSMVVSPRFLVRNDSERFSFEVKQAGAPDGSVLKLGPGCVEPFYWADFRLPGLVCVSPCDLDNFGNKEYRWSGGFDICNLGMVPLRIRRKRQTGADTVQINSIRAHVEIRPSTGGSGINVSFREEDPTGNGSLFRVENHSPFPIWVSQDGVLANPSAVVDLPTTKHPSAAHTKNQLSDKSELDGDMLRSSACACLSLDVPYRQGKYAHRKEASLEELLRVRVALAPLSHRSGIETVKLVGLTAVGDYARLNPSKLIGSLSGHIRNELQSVRVLAIVTSDGPTRVLKFMMITVTDQDVFGNPFRDVSYMSSRQSDNVAGTKQSGYGDEILAAAVHALEELNADRIQPESEAKRHALYDVEDPLTAKFSSQPPASVESTSVDQIYIVRAEFSGFLLSLVDSAPSEIAVVSVRNFNALAQFNDERSSEASIIVTIGWLQVDNHVPNAPFKVAVRPNKGRQSEGSGHDTDTELDGESPVLMGSLVLAPKHSSGMVCLRSVTVAPRNLIIAIDLAFMVRLQRFAMGIKGHAAQASLQRTMEDNPNESSDFLELKRSIPFPEFRSAADELEQAASTFGAESQRLYFEGFKILPAGVTLSVAPARALTPTQARLEGKEIAAIHQAVRKGDVLVGSSSALLGVRVGRKNTTPLAVVRGVFKSILVDALLRLDGASLNFAGVALQNHISTGHQLSTYLSAHYIASLRQNVPALLGSLAAIGNPMGLIRGLGFGVSDFVNEPVRGLKKSVKELDPTHLVDGVARGTESLARHAVGGFADSASLLTETFSKNMAVLTLDRRYAQKRDRNKQLRLNSDSTVNLASGVESGFHKLVRGFMDGAAGVVKAPIRGAERRGIEGFAKGVGKGLLGLLVKPMIGISDAATDVMLGVKNTMENDTVQQQKLSVGRDQYRPRRPLYGPDKVLRIYNYEDAAAATLMLSTRCAGENYLSHIDLGDRVALLSVRRLIMLGSRGEEQLSLKYYHVSKLEVRSIPKEDGSAGWGIVVILRVPRKNGSEVEVIMCASQEEASDLCSQIQRGVDLVESESEA